MASPASAATSEAGAAAIYLHHYRSQALVRASSDALFGELDDHQALARHMTKPSPMMAGASMRFEFDRSEGKAVGSKIRMIGRVLGLTLDVEEVVTERTIPSRKVWETVGEPNLLVMGRYRMGFTIEPLQEGSLVTMFIDYARPLNHPWLGRFFGSLYARWCTGSMVKAAASMLDQPHEVQAAKRNCCATRHRDAEDETVDEADRESFPASDPPPWTLGTTTHSNNCCCESVTALSEADLVSTPATESPQRRAPGSCCSSRKGTQ